MVHFSHQTNDRVYEFASKENKNIFFKIVEKFFR